jgi:hypothetical protein
MRSFQYVEPRQCLSRLLRDEALVPSPGRSPGGTLDLGRVPRDRGRGSRGGDLLALLSSEQLQATPAAVATATATLPVVVNAPISATRRSRRWRQGPRASASSSAGSAVRSSSVRTVCHSSLSLWRCCSLLSIGSFRSVYGGRYALPFFRASNLARATFCSGLIRVLVCSRAAREGVSKVARDPNSRTASPSWVE